MEKPTAIQNTTDFRIGLLWVMGRIEEAHRQEVLAAFENEFGALIPESQRRLSRTDGKEIWLTNVAWSSSDLVKAGLLHKSRDGSGIWTISEAGRELVSQPLTFQEARTEVLRRINRPPTARAATGLPATLGGSLKPYVKLATISSRPAAASTTSSQSRTQRSPGSTRSPSMRGASTSWGAM